MKINYQYLDELIENDSNDKNRFMVDVIYKSMMEKKSILRFFSRKRKISYYEAQIYFISIVLDILRENRARFSQSLRHIHNLILFSNFFLYTVRFKCERIAALDRAKLAAEDMSFLKNYQTDFYVPLILAYPANKQYMDTIFDLLKDTTFVLDPNWYELYKRRMFFYRTYENTYNR